MTSTVLSWFDSILAFLLLSMPNADAVAGNAAKQLDDAGAWSASKMFKCSSSSSERSGSSLLQRQASAGRSGGLKTSNGGLAAAVGVEASKLVHTHSDTSIFPSLDGDAKWTFIGVCFLAGCFGGMCAPKLRAAEELVATDTGAQSLQADWLEEEKRKADYEYDKYQGHLSNLLMMGTMLFGFCITGTFLSMSFTGEETVTGQNNAYLIDFFRRGLWSAVLSAGATILSLVLSSRAANQYISWGAVAAMRVIRNTMFCICAAEICLYLSFYYFMRSVESYALMSYTGPDICPMRQLYESNGNFSAKFEKSSFCAQLGDDFWHATNRTCKGRKTVEWPEKDTCSATKRENSDLLCNVFDCYSSNRSDNTISNSTTLTLWFGWWWSDREEHPEWTKYGLNRFGEVMSDEEVWQRIAKESAEASCEKDLAKTLRNIACKNIDADHPAPNNSQATACAQARATYLQADKCAGAKEADALKCRKVCQWFLMDIKGDTNSLKWRRLKEILKISKGDPKQLKWERLKEMLKGQIEFAFMVIKIIIIMVAVFRVLACVRLTIHACRKNIIGYGWGALLAADIGGILDDVIGAQDWKQSYLPRATSRGNEVNDSTDDDGWEVAGH